MEMPVYLFTGFLESGKTKFIQETMEDERFDPSKKTLLLICEEGEEEYIPEHFVTKKFWAETVENEEDLTEELFLALYKKYKFQRVMIEYNGMWELNTLYGALPEGWMIYQEMMFADATTFLNYNANMRSLMVDKLQSAEIVVLNRYQDGIDRMAIHQVVRASSRRADIAYEYEDGRVEYDDIEDPLPFDVDAPVIEIADDDYAIWYRDLSEDMQKYIGKTVRFKGTVAYDDKLPRGCYVIGRHVMTCCQDDIAYQPVVVKTSNTAGLHNRDWFIIEAKISFAFHELYQEKGPVLNEIKREPAEMPEKQVATFY